MPSYKLNSKVGHPYNSRTALLVRGSRNRSWHGRRRRPHDRSRATSSGLLRILASRNPLEELHRLFPALPEEEYPLNVFACALSKEILLQGKMFITQNYVCFYSNIFGFETKVVIELKDVVLIKREKTVFVLPNAIALKTLRKKFFFCSFLSRETVYKLLSRTWQKALIEAASENSGRGYDSSYDSDPGANLDSSEFDRSYNDDLFYNNNDTLAKTDINANGTDTIMLHSQDGRNTLPNEDDVFIRNPTTRQDSYSNGNLTPHKTPKLKLRKGCPLWDKKSKSAVLWLKVRLGSRSIRKEDVTWLLSGILIALVLFVSLTSIILLLRIYLLSNVLKGTETCPGCTQNYGVSYEDVSRSQQESFQDTLKRMKQVVGQNMISVKKAYAALDDFHEKMTGKSRLKIT